MLTKFQIINKLLIIISNRQIDYFKKEYTGGVTAYTKDQFLRMNGYSNLYYGWGGEGFN